MPFSQLCVKHIFTCLSGNTERPTLSTKILSGCSLLLRTTQVCQKSWWTVGRLPRLEKCRKWKSFTNGNIPWQYLPERSGSVANGSPSPFRHSQRNPPNWFTHLAMAGSQSFISGSYQVWSLKQPLSVYFFHKWGCLHTKDSFISVLNQCNVEAESRSLVFVISSRSDARGEVEGH